VKWSVWDSRVENTRTVIGKEILTERPTINVEEEVPMSKKQSRKPVKSFEERRAAKKATVLRTEKRSRLPLIAILAGAAVVVVIALVFLSRMGGEPGSVASSLKGRGSRDSVTFPVERFRDGKARHYEYKTDNGITIKYFIIRSSDGVIRAAFDACDVCWPAAKGYYQQGDFMVCRNCGRRFASVLVNEVKGGCNPAPLPRHVVDGKLVIKVRDIVEEGKKYFDFSRRGG
jgi:uncharacterized membrane protein